MRLSLLVLAASTVFAAPAPDSTADFYYPAPSHSVFELPNGSDQRLEVVSFDRQEAAALEFVLNKLSLASSNKLVATDKYF